jgi:hypothetical protein
MLQQLSLPLQITLVGMGLVFASILLLWGLMAALVRVLPEKEEPGAVTGRDELELKQRAAAAAVSAALAREAAEESGTQVHEFPLPPTAQVSAWQTVMRTKMLNKRGSVR